MRVFVLFLLLLISCKDIDNKKEVLPKRKIDIILEKLQNDFPNFQENEMVRKNMEVELSKKIDSIYKLNYLDDIPLKVLKISDNPHGKGALVHFYADNDYYENKDNYISSDYIKFDLIAFMDKDKASQLKENAIYLIKGKMLTKLNQTELFLIVSTAYFGPKTIIEPNSEYSGTKYKIGAFLLEASETKEIIL